MNEMIFVEGMNFKPRPENAPETFRGGIYFKYPEFARFMEKHKNEKGWVNIKMMKSKEKGTIYFILDTWKPPTSATSPIERGYAEEAGISLKDHPFVTDEDLAGLDQMKF